ncbi:MAG: adenylosuccinate synthase [Spirochaetia bacterium]|nr:adenylosuccinate synthase [Spirochaetia bacterium]
MPATLIIGTQWGDEGKAKVIDYLSNDMDIVVRYQGGSNAGHTVKVDGNTYVFHLIPSGILYPDVICVLGAGMAIDPEAFFNELQSLELKNIQYKDRLRVADNAHILLPHHRLMDQKSEENLGDNKIGTTKRGIGLCYADKVARVGIRLADIYTDSFYTKRLPHLIENKNILLEKIYGIEPLKISEVSDYLKEYAEKFQKYVVNVSYYLNMELGSAKKVMLEGAQGTMLDLDYGTYPFVTSSNPTTGGAIIGSGINFQFIENVIGITKAYVTRVGEGPFPTEIMGADADHLRKLGNEFGATTGRPRRVGWFDVEIIRHSARVNGLHSIVLTKLDILDSFESIKVAVGYELRGKRISYFPSSDYDNIRVLYEEYPGWNEPIHECKNYGDLPKNAKKYITALEKFCGVPIKLISVGPSRESTLVKNKS